MGTFGQGVARVLIAAVCPLVVACGYRADYAGAQTERFTVVVARAPIADPLAAGEVASGAREELARRGALATSGYPRVEIEVIREDERGESIARDPGGQPSARMLADSVVARAWIRRAPHAEPERDTGDLRGFVRRAVDHDLSGAVDLRADAIHDDDARRAAGRRIGERIARRILGEPVAPNDE